MIRALFGEINNERGTMREGNRAMDGDSVSTNEPHVSGPSERVCFGPCRGENTRVWVDDRFLGGVGVASVVGLV